MAWMAIVAIGTGITVFLSVVFLLKKLSTSKSRKSALPGLQPSSDQYGNMSDIAKAGSLHQFLMGLHRKFGPVASFWWNTEYTVSIASAEVFKDHQHIFDRPVNQFKLFEPLFTPHSIQYANGEDGKSRRFTYDKLFSHDALEIYYDKLQKVADEIANMWNKAEADDHLPLGEHMFLFAVKAALVVLLGDHFNDDEEALAFKKSLDTAWWEMEARLTNPEPPAEDSARSENFKKAVATLRKIVGRTVKEREERGSESRDFLLIDAIIGHHPDEEHRVADAVTYTVGAFLTTGNVLTWCIYFLSLNEEVEEKLYKEIMDVLGPNEQVTHQSLGKLKYTRQVLDETLRCSVVAPWAARFSNEDMTIGGYNVPAKTPVIHALGVSLMDEKVWPSPNVFDPDRFSEENSAKRPNLAFSPYGFAGKRSCPVYCFAYMEATICLVTLLQKFKVHLIPGQDVVPVHGLVTHPKEEIWVTVTKRAKEEGP